jgi:hypothetical protein
MLPPERRGNGRLKGIPRVPPSPVPPGFARHEAHGMCRSCYPIERRKGNLTRTTRPAPDVIEDFRILLDRGLSRTDAAARLGMKPDSVYQAHRRSGVPYPKGR